jgi:hypothetical protein
MILMEIILGITAIFIICWILLLLFRDRKLLNMNNFITIVFGMVSLTSGTFILVIFIFNAVSPITGIKIDLSYTDFLLPVLIGGALSFYQGLQILVKFSKKNRTHQKKSVI